MGCWAKLKSSGWAYPTMVLSLYGFFANCRVAEPFLTPYLIGSHKNISEEVVRMHACSIVYNQVPSVQLASVYTVNSCSIVVTDDKITMLQRRDRNDQLQSCSLFFDVSHRLQIICFLSGHIPTWSSFSPFFS